jgi:DNA repair exonuclease SbcCD ATPase subunit
MVLVRVILLLATVASASDPRPTYKEYQVAKAAEKESAEYAEAKEAKMAAVDKVVTMLEDLQAQVLKEGEEEAKTYDTFACWCKTTMSEKQEAIQTGKDDKTRLSATIEKESETRKELDTKVAEFEGAIAEAQKEMKDATFTSHEALAKYTTNEEDLSAALSALKGAIKELKSSKTPSLLQLQSVSQTIRHATLMADALGLDVSGSALLQQDEVPVEMENYKFHSDSIIETLEKLLTEFTAEKNKIDAEEVERVHTHEMLMQEQTDLIKAKTKDLEEKQKEKAQTTEEIASNNQQLSTVSALLLDDMEYLAETNDVCSKKAQTWDQRSKVRADELHALTAAIEIVKGTVAEKTQNTTIRFAQLGVTVRMADAVASSDGAMEAIEASAEDAENDSPASFFAASADFKACGRSLRQSFGGTPGDRSAPA